MNNRLFSLIDRFQGYAVLVMGEAMLDTYRVGSTHRLSPEAPVPVVAVGETRTVAGGAANTAVNLAALGAKPLFISVIGDDSEGEQLRQALAARGVPTDHLLVQPGRRTLSKNRVVAGDQIVVRFDEGSTDAPDAAVRGRLLDELRALFMQSDAVLVSDYSYGILTPRVIQELAALQARAPRLVAVDSKNLANFAGVGATLIKPNYREAVQLLELAELAGTAERAEQMLSHGERLLAVANARVAAITLDSDGALIFEQGSEPYRTYAQPSSNTRAAGAGDTFASTFTLALTAGAATHAAAELASAAAALVVQKEGTVPCTAQELRGYIASADKYVQELPRLAARVEFYRQQGKRIVFTNGCFDILHRGHIGYLNRAKELGDILIVGMNSDESVRRLKGPDRPINSLQDRVRVLEALSCVDHIIGFAKDTPLELVRALRPDVFVKGGDYTRETVPEAAVVEELGGRIEILPYLPEHSTTSIIERIRETNGTSTKANGMRAGNGRALGLVPKPSAHRSPRAVAERYGVTDDE